ncbi:MAG: ATP-binding cassette domain-containing protein [Bdellovibrionales bacterium]
MTTLSLDGITKSFGAVDVLRGVSVPFTPGEVTAIVGDNGAGKSTLLKIIAGQYPPDGGRILLNGQAIERAEARIHRKLGIEMVYQDLALAKRQSVLANLFMGRELSHPLTGFLCRKKMTLLAKEKLEQLSLRLDDVTHPVGLLSGGQQQAIAIARAVMFDPQILLLDEPTAALAAREVAHVLNVIRLQRNHARSVILISHRLHDVLDVADRIIVMKQGQVIADLATKATSLTQLVEMIVS